MDVLIYHRELSEGDLPDCCIRCGADDTALTATIITTNIPVMGGSFRYQTLELPFCRAHEKPPWFSLSYPGARAFTEEGVLMKNVCADFVDALEERRERTRRRRKRGEAEPTERREERQDERRPRPREAPEPRRVSWVVWALFGGGLVLATLLLAGGVAAFVMLTTSGKPVIQPQPPGMQPQPLKEPPPFEFPKGPPR